MLIIEIHNDGTGGEMDANYNVRVLVTLSPTKLMAISRGRIEGHVRGDGWKALLRRIANELPDG